MAIEQTFSIIKPDAVERNLIGAINARLEAAGFVIVGMRLIQMTVEQAENFYAEHKGKPFFDSLVEYMTSGRLWFRFCRQRTRLLNIVKFSALQTRKTRLPEPFVTISRSA